VHLLKTRETLFVAVHDEMTVLYRRKFIDIINSEPEAQKYGFSHKLAATLCLTENEPLRDKLLDLCKNDPLALHRLWKLHRDFNTHASTFDAISGHAERVTWQIFRIYQARNNVVHAGRLPSYIESLILNLAGYFRGVLATIINRARRAGGKTDLDQIVMEIGIEYAIFVEYFQARKSRDEFTREDLLRLNDIR
jgi:hypothetical protein